VVKQYTLMEKKEMNMERAKYIFVCGLIALLGWKNYSSETILINYQKESDDGTII
jgi:hypothetical protein